MNARRHHMLDRAKKLMAIANDEAASVNEAVMALSQAQKIMDQYALETWMLEQDGTQAIEQVEERRIIAPNKSHNRYYVRILDNIAEANACRAFYNLIGNKYDGYTLVGRPTDCDTVETLFTSVCLYEATHWRDNMPDWKEQHTISALVSDEYRAFFNRRLNAMASQQTKNWHKSYIIGLAEAIRQRLSGRTVETSGGQDLISLKTQPVDDYVNRMSGIDYKTIHLTVNKEAYEDGMKSGRNINLNQTGITNPTLQISR